MIRPGIDTRAMDGSGQPVIPEVIPGVNPTHEYTFKRALHHAHTLPLEEVLALLLFYGSKTRYGVNSICRRMQWDSSFNVLLDAARTYVGVGKMELEDIRRSLPDEPGMLLDQAVARMATVLVRFEEGVERIAKRPPSPMEQLQQNVVAMVAAYSSIGGEIETQVVNLRALLKPDSDPAIGDALRTIGELLQRIKEAAQEPSL